MDVSTCDKQQGKSKNPLGDRRDQTYDTVDKSLMGEKRD